MAQFFYQATDSKGKFVEGDIEAPDQRTAIQKIRSINHFPIQIHTQKPKKSFSLDIQLPSYELFPPVSPKELLNFTQQLSTLINSGLTLDESLGTLVKLTEKDKTRNVLSDIHKRVHAGSTFSAALAEHPKVFSKLYMNMVRAGEAGGVLGSVLDRLEEFLEDLQELKGKVASAMIYPAILVLVCGSALVFLMLFVVPQLSSVFGEDMQGLPVTTLLVISMSHLFIDYWWALLLGLVFSGLVFRNYTNTERGGHQWDALKLKVPLLGSLIQKVEVSRFSRTMSTLLKSGVPVLQALLITRSILTNKVISKAMEHLHDGLKSGKGITEPLRKINVFPPLAIHMITVGEETGSLDDMLLKIATIYDKEVERSIKQIISLMEPMMILMMACIIGFIVISMLMGIFSMNEIPL